MTFNPKPNFNTPNAKQRRVAVEACIVAAIAEGPKTLYAIRWFVQEQPGFEWVMPSLIAETVAKMHREKRLTAVYRSPRVIAEYELPRDPMEPIVHMQKRQAANSEREMRIIASLNWPKWFHVPSREDLLPTARTYSLDAVRPIHI